MRGFLVVCLLGLAGCTPSYQVRTDWDRDAQFARYRTWTFAAERTPDTPGRLDNALVRRRVEALLAARLDAEGLEHAPAGQTPDLRVRYWLGARERLRVDHVSTLQPWWDPWGPRSAGRWGPVHDEVIVDKYAQASLVVDLVDARRDELVWRAYLVGALPNDDERLYPALAAALAEAFDAYPPRGR